MQETKLGPEEITTNVGEDALHDLDEKDVRYGAEVKPNDCLVGKVTPKVKQTLQQKKDFFGAIFGEKAREVRDATWCNRYCS